MRKACYGSSLVLLIGVLGFVGVADAQPDYPMMDKLAEKVIEKYRTSSCQELAQQKKSQPTAGPQQKIQARVMQMLRNDRQMRTQFLNKVSAPIANKMFECGMIP